MVDPLEAIDVSVFRKEVERHLDNVNRRKEDADKNRARDFARSEQMREELQRHKTAENMYMNESKKLLAAE